MFNNKNSTPSVSKLKLKIENKSKEYQEQCLNFFKENSRCYEEASNLLLKEFNLSFGDINGVIDEDRQIFKENKQNLDEGQTNNNNNYSNIIIDEELEKRALPPSEVKTIFINFAKRYLGEVLLLEKSSIKIENINEDYYYFKLLMINLYNNDILLNDYKLTFTELMYLVNKNNLLNDGIVLIAYNKLKKIELVLSGLIE